LGPFEKGLPQSLSVMAAVSSLFISSVRKEFIRSRIFSACSGPSDLKRLAYNSLSQAHISLSVEHLEPLSLSRKRIFPSPVRGPVLEIFRVLIVGL
jgi:hypothetical protein